MLFDALEKKFQNTEQAKLINWLYQGSMKDFVRCKKVCFGRVCVGIADVFKEV